MDDSETFRNQLIEYLHSFVDFNETELTEVASFFQFRTLGRDDYFLRYNHVSSEIAFVCRGVLEMRTFIHGKESITDFFSPYLFMSDYISFLTERPSEVTVQALQDTVLLVIEKRQLNRLYEVKPKYQKFGRLLAESHSMEFIDRIRRREQSPKQRYEDFLSRHPGLSAEISQHKIASYLGITPEWLSKKKKKK